MSYDQVRQYLMSNPELWSGKAEIEMEKYVPLTAKNIEIGKFSKDEALDYYEDEKELDSGRMSTYISSMTVDVMDENGDSVGNLIKLKDEDGIVTYQATDVDGNDLTLDEFDTKQEAVDAILAAYNKVKEKEFVKEQKRLAKAKEKAEAKQAPAPKAPYVQEVIPAINEEQAAGEKEMEALKKGDKITTTHPMRLLKGIYGKRNVDGSIRSAHTGVNGIFSSITEKIARRYEGEEGVVVFEIPAGVTVETVEIPIRIDSKAVPISSLRQLETDAINASDAQVVKLITGDSRGRESQYIIKDPALRKIGYKPSQREAEANNTPKDIASRIRNKKQKGVLSAIDFGISVTIYNGALEFMASQVEKGTKLGNAIANTIKWVDDKMKGEKWNKGAFGKYMNDTYKVTLGDGREVEVVRDDSKETAEVVNGWYQPIEQKILDSKEESLPANKWAERLKSKEDEDLWTGARAFLEEKGTERVSRKELLDFIKDNRIEIVTVVKGEGYVVRDTKADKDIKEFDDYEEAVDFVLEQRKKGNDYSVLEKDKKKSVKFEQYQLPGDKENYKEVLVTLPKKLPIPDGNYIVYTDKGAAERREYIKGFDTEKEAFDWIKENEDKYPYAIDYETRRIVESIESGDVFNSSHFDEPNILVHLRMNTRTDANGNKVLFLEEVQSDWGQKGKKEGFKDVKKYENDIKETKNEIKSIEAEIDKTVSKMYDLGLPSGASSSELSRFENGNFKTKEIYNFEKALETVRNNKEYDFYNSEIQKIKDSQISIGKKRNELLRQKERLEDRLKWQERELISLNSQIPSAPFVTDTNSWTKLGLKVALREAVKQGADKIAWTTGEQQNDRYDLSKQLSSITVDKTGQNSYMVMARSKGDERLVVDQSYRKEELPDIIGKELAADMVAEADKLGVYGGTVYRAGEGLSIGGKGMKGFYGSAQEGSKGIIGGVAEKLFGQKVGETKIEGNPQSSISITPELKAQVEKGLPLFGTEQQDAVVKFLRAQRTDPNIIGLNAGLWNGLLDIIEKAWLASKSAAKAIQAGIDWLKQQKEDPKEWEKYLGPVRERMQKLESELAGEKPPVTPPAAGREMPEGEEKETEKPILGRAFRGTTDEAIAKKLVEMGLYRTPANIAEAFEIGQELVSSLGVDEAIKLGTKGDVPNGLVRIGILKAVLADINKQRDALPIGEGAKGEQRYLDALDELNDKYAQALAAFSPSLTESGQVLRAWQEVVQSAEFEFDYEGRKTRYKTLFGDEAYTEEVDERFKEYDRKIKEANKEKQELQEKIDRLEAQGIVDNIDQQKKKATSFFKQAAERVRKLKLSRPGIFSAATPASLAWDATIEAVAVVLEASGTLEEAIVAGVKKLKTTSWYKSLTDDKKKEAEEQFSSNVKDTYIVKATVDEKGKIQIPSGLLRSYVTSGVKDANAIIDDILSYLKEANPDIIDADVRAAILEVGRKEAPKSAEITKNVNTLKTIIRMIGQLEQVQQGKRIAKGEGKQREMDNTVKSLKKQIEQLHIQQFGVKPGALTDEQRLANIKKNALNRIADMKAMQPRPEPRERVKWDAEMSKIANEEFRLKEKWNEEFKEAERKKEGAMKKFFRGSFLAVNFSKTIMTGIGDLGVLLIQGSVLPFRSASVTKEAIANMGRAFLSQEAYVEQLRKINESELYRVIRKSGLDLPQITSLEIERVEEATLGALGETIFDVMFLPFKYVPKIGPKMYEWAKNHINPARVFNRTQTSYMNTLRYGSFALSAQNLMEKGITYEDNPKSYKDVAAMINTMTGRTRVIGEESAAVMRGLNLVFYSPKNWASVIKMFTPVVLVHVGKRRADSVGVLGMSEAQQTFIRTYASFVATSAALMFLIKAISDSEDEDEEKKRETGNVSVDWENPQSAAFNKIRIGNQIFDPWGGKQQIITLQARMMIHFLGGRAFKDPYTGIEKTLEETPRFKHPLGLMSEYAKGKFSPYMSAVVKLLSSQEAKGREWYVRRPAEGGPTFNLLDPVSESYTNITYNAVDDLYSNQPLTISEVMTLFLIAGGGINTLNDQEAKTIVSQIREQVNPGEDEKRKYAANMASRLKDGDVEGAATVYDEAMGIKGVTDKKKIVSLRREGGDKMYESASKDVVAQRYGVDDMFRKHLLQVVYENKPVAVSSSMSAKKKQVLDALNSLTPEQKQEVKLDYEYRYEELMNVAKGIDKLTSQPNKYEKRAAREYWVRQYKKATGKK
jgi:hypothetical protein